MNETKGKEQHISFLVLNSTLLMIAHWGEVGFFVAKVSLLKLKMLICIIEYFQTFKICLCIT